MEKNYTYQMNYFFKNILSKKTIIQKKYPYHAIIQFLMYNFAVFFDN